MDVCPVCRTQLEPTWYKDVRNWQGAVVHQIPMDPACPNDCINQVEPEVYNTAVARLLEEQRADGR